MSEYILGVDPGTRRTGFGIVRTDGRLLDHVDHGVIRLPAERPLAERLMKLDRELGHLFGRYAISTTVVESIFFGKNADSAFKLGHARGVCLAASARAGVPVVERAARYVKKAVTGSGAASKDHVQLVIRNLLRMPESAMPLDASDALALAITHARHREIEFTLRTLKEGQA